MRVKRVSPTTCIIEKEGAMHVPGKIYLSPLLEETVDKGALEQVKNVACLPGIVGESIAMPDIHIGYGFPIGGVAAFDAENGIISPGGIGFDINCGVRMLATSLYQDDVQPLIAELMDMLNSAVPSGTGRDSSVRVTHEEMDNVLREGSHWAAKHGYATPDDIEKTEEGGRMRAANPAAVSERAKDRGVNQLGTLGAGNHFVEVQVVQDILDEHVAQIFGLRKHQVVVMIHCGSRGLGHQVCTDYLELMQKEYPDIESSLPEKNLMYAPIKSKLGEEYFTAMASAANFAWCNRQIITHHVRKTFQRLFPSSQVSLVYDVSHNIAKKEEYDGKLLCVHRKGATRAFPPGSKDIPRAYEDVGQPVLIPGSMGTASYVLVGAGAASAEAFGSCCHGAGRTLSRTAAVAQFSGEVLRRELRDKGVHVKAGSTKGLVEEAPGAYKDVDEVIRVVSQAGLAVPVAKTVPIGVLKG